MAHGGRGGGRSGSPSIGNRSSNGDVGRRNYWHRRWIYYYVPLDNTYVEMQIGVSLIILLACAIAYLSSYKTAIIDPIQDLKSTFFNSYIITLGVFLILLFIVSSISKNKEVLQTRLILLLCISFIVMMFFGIYFLSMDSKYNISEFEKIYEEVKLDDKTTENQRVVIGLSLVIKDYKEYYLDECMKAFNIFKIRTYCIFSMHLLLNILLVFLILKLNKININKEKLDKNDAIIFDEEQNCRY